VLVDRVRGGLLPPSRVGDDVVQVRFRDLAHVAAGPEIDFRG
jgi:hypothetical protein